MCSYNIISFKCYCKYIYELTFSYDRYIWDRDGAYLDVVVSGRCSLRNWKSE